MPETESRPFSQQVGARVFVRTTVLKRLAKAGVRDERDPMTNAINDRLDYVLTSQDGWSSTLFDLAGAELTLANRLDELNIANLEIARLLTDLDSKTEEQQIQQSFRGLVNMSGD